MTSNELSIYLTTAVVHDARRSADLEWELHGILDRAVARNPYHDVWRRIVRDSPHYNVVLVETLQTLYNTGNSAF